MEIRELTFDPTTRFYVYPSWATLAVPFKSLSSAFADPLSSGLLDRNDLQWLKESRDDVIYVPPHEIVSGAMGGGIIEVNEAMVTQPSIISILLSHIASMDPPEGMPHRGVNGVPHVTVLDGRGGDHKIAGRTNVRSYCPVSIEHAHYAQGRIYWVIDARNQTRILECVDDLVACGSKFGVTLERSQASEDLMRESKQMFASPRRSQIWFEASCARTNADFHFAAMVYSAYRLKDVSNRSLHSMSLVSTVSGKPSFRVNWNV